MEAMCGSFPRRVSQPPVVSMPLTACITFGTANSRHTSYYGRKNVISCSSLPRIRITSSDQASSLDVLRFGDLTEDRSSSKKKFVIRYSEVGIDGNATFETIARLLQEVGGNYDKGDADRYGTSNTMRKLHLVWVYARTHIEVHKYPAWSDMIEIESWFQRDGKIGLRRNWIIKDYANGELIGRAASKCFLMNENTRRLERVSDDLLEEFLASCPSRSELAFPEENNRSMRKIAKLKDPAEYSSLRLSARRSDLDLNNHVNSVTYIEWALESIPQAIIDTHELEAITLDYKHECKHGDIVDSLASREPPLDDDLTNTNKSSSTTKKDLIEFIHLLRSADNGLTISRCCTVWRMKPAKG